MLFRSHFDGGGEDLVGRYVPVRIVQALGHSLLGERLRETEAQEGALDRIEAARP